jgi:CheY-specific phosphatase CheX
MRVEFVAPFVDGAVTVLSDMFKAPFHAGRVSLENALAPKDCLSVNFRLTGDAGGYILFSVPEKTALRLWGLMNGRESGSMDDPLVLDSLAELMNMVIGRSVTLLGNKGFSLNITPPVIFRSGEPGVSTAVETLVFRITSVYGELLVSVAIMAGV